MKKTININKRITKPILIGFVASFVLVLIIEHWSNIYVDFNKQRENKGEYYVESINYNYPLIGMRIYTPFGTNLEYSGNGYTVADAKLNYGKLNKYPHKLKYFIKALIADFQFVIYFWIGISGLIYLLSNYKFKMK